MTLVHKAALTVTIFAIANLVFALAIKRNWIDPAFEDFERKLAEKTMVQVAEALDREISHVDAITYEYSNWDATYDYAVSGDPGYHEDNLDLDVLAA